MHEVSFWPIKQNTNCCYNKSFSRRHYHTASRGWRGIVVQHWRIFFYLTVLEQMNDIGTHKAFLENINLCGKMLLIALGNPLGVQGSFLASWRTYSTLIIRNWCPLRVYWLWQGVDNFTTYKCCKIWMAFSNWNIIISYNSHIIGYSKFIINIQNNIWFRLVGYSINIPFHSDLHTYTHTCIRIYTHTHVHAYIHKYIHTDTQTYIHTHVHSLSKWMNELTTIFINNQLNSEL
jgi:hypothetical protein